MEETMAENTDDQGYRKIPEEELIKILEEHKKWLDSDNKEGERADLKYNDLQGNALINALSRSSLAMKLDLRSVNLYGANLQGADLRDVNLQGADLRRANLQYTKLQRSQLQNAQLQKAELHDASLRNSDLRGAILKQVNLENVDVHGIKFNRRGRYYGIRVATCYGNARFKRFAQDQDYIESFRNSGKHRFILYCGWLALADCGRSLLLWASWSILFAIFFGWIFFRMGYDSFEISNLPWTLGTMIYYSIVTFTTLGFGDVVPKTTDASWWVMAEVIVGYMMLGGLISIFATKLARRS
jgi:uncharacterized protein YjbI with pentapeptide repeats